MKKLLILSAILTLSGCASHLTQQQCLTMDWRTEGYNDAIAGKPQRDLTNAIQDCAKFNLKVKTGKYHAGWIAGLKKYCRPTYNMGIADGKKGYSATVINARQPLCESGGLRLNLKQYEAGRVYGLKTFCSPQSKTGYLDGQAGKPRNTFSERAGVCSSGHVGLNLSAYNSGYNTGIKSFCTYDNGMSIAQRGEMLPDVCPGKLHAKFAAGWKKQRRRYCNNTKNAFAMGKSNKSYPEICSANLYASFKSEYDRGHDIWQRITDENDKMNRLNADIASNASRYGLERTASGFYQTGANKSPDAASAVYRVNDMVKEAKKLKDQIFTLKVMR